MTESEQVLEILDEYTVLLKEMRDLLRRIADAPLWACGCGHVNGINLAVCARCGRKPGA